MVVCSFSGFSFGLGWVHQSGLIRDILTAAVALLILQIWGYVILCMVHILIWLHDHGVLHTNVLFNNGVMYSMGGQGG